MEYMIQLPNECVDEISTKNTILLFLLIHIFHLIWSVQFTDIYKNRIPQILPFSSQIQNPFLYLFNSVLLVIQQVQKMNNRFKIQPSTDLTKLDTGVSSVQTKYGSKTKIRSSALNK